jgi:hypothetical protein
MFACIHRIQWHADFIDSLRKVLDKLNTQPDLKMMLLQGISSAIHDPTFELSTTDREANFEILASSQNDIGWPQMIRGASVSTGLSSNRPTLNRTTKSAAKNSLAHAGSNTFSFTSGQVSTSHGRYVTPISMASTTRPIKNGKAKLS